MQLAVECIVTKHRSEFTDIAEKLFNIKFQLICESFVAIADQVFMDMHFNWGRIVTLYAFATWLANYCASRCDDYDLTSKIGERWVCIWRIICLNGFVIKVVGYLNVYMHDYSTPFNNFYHNYCICGCDEQLIPELYLICITIQILKTRIIKIFNFTP